ncbi:MAG: LysR family transcriptional regulator [Rhizobiaceae bacterium]
MNIDILHTFVIVVEAGSMAEAARRLNVAPTTIAQQMRALERDVGSALLTRAGRSLQPTLAGRRALERARLIVNAARDLRSEAHDAELPNGPLLLGATHSAISGLLPKALKSWSQSRPEIEVHIEEDDTIPLIEKVTKNELDAAVVVKTGFALPKTCIWQDLRSEELILATHDKITIGSPLEIISTQPYIRFERSVVGGRMAEAYLQSHGLNPRAQYELDGVENIARLVSEGIGVALLPDCRTVANAALEIKRWKLPPPVPSRTIGYMANATSARVALAELFGHLLREAARLR